MRRESFLDHAANVEVVVECPRSIRIDGNGAFETRLFDAKRRNLAHLVAPVVTTAPRFTHFRELIMTGRYPVIPRSLLADSAIRSEACNVWELGDKCIDGSKFLVGLTVR